MKLKSLSLLNYRVAVRQDWHFEADVVSITGANGTGKTNILDAIHYMCLTRSYFNQQDQQLVRFGADFFNLQARIVQDEAENLLFCAWQGGKKGLRKNGVQYDRLADHIGLFPVVMIAPTDLDLIYEGSEARRRFADMLLSQTDHAYLLALMRYNKILQQKQALLRQYKQDGRLDIILLDVFDMQLLPLNTELHSKRVAWLDLYNPIFGAIYRSISGDKEQVAIRYESSFNEIAPAKAMQQAGKADLESGRCSMGIHRDELLFTINGHPVKRFGSQGQQKAFLISLKLAQSIYLSELTGKKPFLLLDDIFEKLDGQRVNSLLRLVQEERFGQIFLTDTDKKRVEAIFGPQNNAIQYLEL